MPTNHPGRTGAVFSLCLVLPLAAGCAFVGDDIGNPLIRKAQWLSFVGGDDIAAACRTGGPDRVRLVYNALWDQQVRIYEWAGGADPAGADLSIQVVRPMDLQRFDLFDPLGPWRATATRVRVEAPALDDLVRSLEAAGGFGPPAVGLDLPSHSYYWAAATCRQGRFTFTGWAYPSESFAAARFPSRLFALDPDRDQVKPPAAVPFDFQREEARRRGVSGEFLITVGANGRVR